MIRKLKYCPNCLGCNSGTKNVIVDPNDFFTKGKTIRETYYYTNYKGFYTTFTYLDNTTCPRCKAKLIEMNLTEDEICNMLNNSNIQPNKYIRMTDIYIWACEHNTIV